MKTGIRKSFALLLALVLLLGLAPAAALAAGAAPAASDNHGAENYVEWSAPIASCLYETEDGDLCRVEYVDGNVVVETYDDAFHLKTTAGVAAELERFGGFYAGETSNFLVFGQENLEEDDSREVIRVVKYDKAWHRLSQASLYGANTWKPFEAGTLRFAERGGILYLRTCHEMYMTEDGKHHQSTVTLAVRERDMTITDSYFRISGLGGYVSHTFNQFILADSAGNIVTLDHGDAHPRTAVLKRFSGAAGQERLGSFPEEDTVGMGSTLPYDVYNRYMSSRPDSVDLIVFPDAADKNYNYTGAGLGGLEESGSRYLAAVNLDAQDGSASSVRNVAVVTIDKSLSGASELTWLTTEYGGAEETGALSASVPQLVKFSDDRFLVLWEVSKRQNAYDFLAPAPTGVLNYVFVDGSGKPVGEVQTAKGGLSDCRPILLDGDKAVWYVTGGGTPVFYSVDGRGVFSAARSAGSFPDLPLDHWASGYVEEMADLGIVNGNEDGTFRPENSVTLAEFSKMLSHAFYFSEVNGWSSSPWWMLHIRCAYDHGLLNGAAELKNINFTANTYYREPAEAEVGAALTRYQMAQMMYNVLLDRGASLPSEAQRSAAVAAIGDWYAVPEQYRGAVGTCYALGLLNGIDGNFAGEGSMTRAQACAVLSRLLDAVL